MSYPFVLEQYKSLFNIGAIIDTMDVRADSRAAKIVFDYRNEALCYQPDLIITNPPFGIALEIIQKALADCRSGGWVVMLLRLNFFGAECRKAWLQSHMPERCYVHSKRINFTEGMKHPDTGKAMTGDSIEYAHLVWRKDFYPKETKLRVI